MDGVIENTINALKKHGFKAEFAKNREECKDKILALVPQGASVGIPGSASVRATGVVEALKARGHELYDHWQTDLSHAESFRIRKQQLGSDVLLTSTNALSMTGELVNMDGIGNRVAAMIFGPKRVIVCAGRSLKSIISSPF